MSTSLIAAFVVLALYVLIGVCASCLWFFVEMKPSRQGAFFKSLGTSLFVGFVGAPLFIVYAILVNACQAMGFERGSRALAKMK